MYLLRRVIVQPTLRIAVPVQRASCHNTGEAIFQSPSYRRFAVGLVSLQLVGLGAWQLGALLPWLRANAQCSWRNIVLEGKWWAALLAHISHRELDHLATNLGTLLVPVFLMQTLLSWQKAIALCLVAAAGSSAASLAFVYVAFSPGQETCPSQPNSTSLDDTHVPLFPWEDDSFEDLLWKQQSTCGSLGSSALATCFCSTCALWLGELHVKGWRHPILLLFPLVVSMQPLSDLMAAWALLAGLDQSPGGADCAGHLAGSVVGGLAYFLAFRSRGAFPLHPLVPVLHKRC